MKNALAVIMWFTILVVAFTNAFSAKQIGDQSSQVTTDEQIPVSELAAFHDYINSKITFESQKTTLNASQSSAKQKTALNRPQATLKMIDNQNTIYLKKAWTECSAKEPCNDQIKQILGHLPYSTPAYKTSGAHKKKKSLHRVMLASWEDYCKVMGQNNVSCQPFHEPIYFRALGNGEYEVYLRANNQ